MPSSLLLFYFISCKQLSLDDIPTYFAKTIDIQRKLWKLNSRVKHHKYQKFNNNSAMVSTIKKHGKNFNLDFESQLLIKMSLKISRCLIKFKNENSNIKIIKYIDLFIWKGIGYAPLSLTNSNSKYPIFHILQIYIFSKIFAKWYLTHSPQIHFHEWNHGTTFLRNNHTTSVLKYWRKKNLRDFAD